MAANYHRASQWFVWGSCPVRQKTVWKLNRQHYAPAETVALGISFQLLNSLTKASSGERVKETVKPKRDYRLRRHLTNIHPQNCEESWANWSAAPELRTVKYSTCVSLRVPYLNLSSHGPGHGTVGPIVWKRAIYGPGHFRLKAQTQHQIDEGLWWRMVMAQRDI